MTRDRVAGLAFALVFGSALAVKAGITEDFVRDLGEYGKAIDFKALALAQDSPTAAVWGFAFGASSQEAAATEALSRCQALKQKYGIRAECQVAIVGNQRVAGGGGGGGGNGESEPKQDAPHAAPVAPTTPVPSARSVVFLPESEVVPVDVSYSVQWVNGQQFATGTVGDLQVWVSFASDSQPHAMVYVVNGSGSSITFDPTQITLAATTSHGRETVKTFSAEEYEHKVRTKQAWQAALYGLAQGLNNQPQPRTTYVQGTSSATATAWGTGGWASGRANGTYTGTITTWPTAEDYAAASARSNAQIGAMNRQLTESFASIASSLARINTLAPRSYYGGIVYFDKRRSTGYELAVSFGGQVFRFSFSR